MHVRKHRLLRLFVLLLLTAGAALPAAGRCVDEYSELLVPASPAAPGDAGAPRLMLQALVREAQRRSDAIGAARLLAEAAAVDVTETRAGAWPHVSVTGSWGRAVSKVEGAEDAQGGQTRIGVKITAPLYGGGRISQLTDWKRNLSEAARYGQLSMREQVSLRTVSLAIERGRHRLRARVYQQHARKMGCMVEALEPIARANKVRAGELAQASTKLQQAELALAQAVSAMREAETRLRRFAGDGLPSAEGLSSVMLDLPPLQDFLAQAEHSIDIAQMGAEAEAAESYSRSVKALHRPQLSWVLSEAKAQGVGHSSSLLAGVNVSVPLFDSAASHAAEAARLRAAAAKLQRAEALESRKSRMTEVHEQATASFERARSVIEVLRNSDRVRNFTLQQWRELGRRSLFDVMASEAEHYTLRVAYIDALYDAQQATALLWSLGSGLALRLE